MTVEVVDAAVAIAHDISELGLKLFGDVPAHFYSKSLSFSPETLPSNGTIDKMFKYLSDLDLSQLLTPWFVIFDLEAGAINDIPQNATAYAFRDTLFFLQSYAVDLSFGALGKQATGFLDGLNEVLIEGNENTFGAYPGYVDPRLEDGQEWYWRGNYERLRRIKKAVDPGNVFRNPQSVQPAE
jgi:hypothetical protein